MNPYSIPSLISGLFLLTLSFISVSYGRKERVNIIFSLFALLLSLASFSSFIFYESESPQQALGLAKIPFALVVPAMMMALYYTLAITDTIHNLNVIFWKISLRGYMIFLFIIGAIIEILTITTDWIIAGVEFNEASGFEHVHGAFFIFAFLGLSLITGTLIAILYNAYRRSESEPQRILFLYNLIGFSIAYFLTAFVRVGLTYWVSRSYSLSFIPFAIAAVIFALAMLRYQFSLIVELNFGLEKKVVERTRELQDAQTQLVRSEKMAALGKLVAGVAHEINNPLGVVNSNNNTIELAVTKVKNESSDEPKAVKILQTIENLSRVNKTAIERISEIVKSLKKFARLDEAEVVRANIKECVETSLALLNHELEDRIKVVKELVEIPEINCHARDMNQVLMSLLHNAIEAMEGEGEIKISTGKNKDHVWVKICDTGCGISHDHIDKIFDPGFTTKGVGVGTGMGLAIAYQIVKSHKGLIYVESELGKGSTFTVEIPTNGVF